MTFRPNGLNEVNTKARKMGPAGLGVRGAAPGWGSAAQRRVGGPRRSAGLGVRGAAQGRSGRAGAGCGG